MLFKVTEDIQLSVPLRAVKHLVFQVKKSGQNVITYKYCTSVDLAEQFWNSHGHPWLACLRKTSNCPQKLKQLARRVLYCCKIAFVTVWKFPCNNISLCTSWQTGGNSSNALNLALWCNHVSSLDSGKKILISETGVCWHCIRV